ncbi:MAG: hypothetical protein PHQ05_13420 [Sterolibacterium sp.]|nr:hypothetical protein [Sterolibacterium sp.]
MSDKPENQRDFTGRRLLVNLLRALHLVGVAGIGAAVLSVLPRAETVIYASLLIVSGIGIAALDRWGDSAYFSQLNGQTVVFKVALLIGAAWLSGIGTVLFLAVLVGSALMTHAPRWLRHYKLF